MLKRTQIKKKLKEYFSPIFDKMKENKGENGIGRKFFLDVAENAFKANFNHNSFFPIGLI